MIRFIYVFRLFSKFLTKTLSSCNLNYYFLTIKKKWKQLIYLIWSWIRYSLFTSNYKRFHTIWWFWKIGIHPPKLWIIVQICRFSIEKIIPSLKQTFSYFFAKLIGQVSLIPYRLLWWPEPQDTNRLLNAF